MSKNWKNSGQNLVYNVINDWISYMIDHIREEGVKIVNAQRNDNGDIGHDVEQG